VARRIIASTVLVAAILCTAFMAIAAQNYDFHAFYCAAAVARDGGDPYLADPLRACERMRDTILPAPFPGFVIAVIEPLSRLPFAIASKIWTALVVGAIAACALLLVRLTRLSLTFVAAALCLSAGVTSLGFGEVVPFFMCALCAAALFAQSGRWRVVAVLAGASLIEPHLGVPVCAALFVWQPRTRAVLTAIAILFAGASFAALGWHENVEYVTRVLPYHALSEIGSNRQFSLSAIVHAFGASDPWALRAGLVSYIVMGLAGVVVAQRAARHFTNEAFLVLVPPVAVMIGGSFLHVTQINAAIPLGLLLLRSAPRYRDVLTIALVCLAIPWLWIYQPLLITMAAVFAFYMAWEATGRNARWACTSAAVVLTVLLSLNAWSGGHAPSGPSTPARPVPIPPKYAEASWAIANLGYWSSGNAVSWAYRAPTWCGLLLVFGSVCLSVRRRSADDRAAVEMRAAGAAT
jgi:Glycosyltransferase family 87